MDLALFLDLLPLLLLHLQGNLQPHIHCHWLHGVNDWFVQCLLGGTFLLLLNSHPLLLLVITKANSVVVGVGGITSLFTVMDSVSQVSAFMASLRYLRKCGTSWPSITSVLMCFDTPTAISTSLPPFTFSTTLATENSVLQALALLYAIFHGK